MSEAVPTMTVQVRTPTRLVLDVTGIHSVRYETPDGCRTLEPRHLDGVDPLSPGILTLTAATGEQTAAAVDEGILVKAGCAVTIAVRHVIPARGKALLRQALREELARIRNTEADLRAALASLESRFLKESSQVRGHG
ncbi:MAG TPA: hypothetical protein PLP29_02110 [Candidatus Ozemobacteraceae bacterium]|nr:hypothetical protein [Candidatus Ozemobacteraceae bacterium]